ncbi:MAG: recombinase family protein [Pseudomonadota bacterium]
MTRIRCAIYTRKSTEEGLDQSFNSLDAQREACEAYIQSQKQEGWKLLPQRYDDGGVSGGTMDRPALKMLLGEIDAGRIDMVVVYKVDRLTRSLADFAKLVERLDKAGASFVSVTQAFNTSTSMGRLTLNVLLSFAQFEREVTAERIRDKIAASKKKGMWMGGLVPLGYDKGTHGLVVNLTEAETVRRLFDAYLEFGSVRALKEFADCEGLRSKVRTSKDGTQAGGKPFSRGMLYHLLANPIYIGKIKHRDQVFDGLHDPIVEVDIWQRVQDRLAQNRRERASRTNSKSRSPLAGKLVDQGGEPLTPSHASKSGRRYRYYVSKHLIDKSGSAQDGWRIPAAEIERAVAEAVRSNRDVHFELAAHGQAGLSDKQLLARVDRAQITETHLAISVVADGEQPASEITVPYQQRKRGVERRIILETGSSREIDQVLINRILRALDWVDQLRRGKSISEIAKQQSISPEYITHNLHFGLLSPRILDAVLRGTLPPDISAKAITRMQRLSDDWRTQEEWLLG